MTPHFDRKQLEDVRDAIRALPSNVVRMTPIADLIDFFLRIDAASDTVNSYNRALDDAIKELDDDIKYQEECLANTLKDEEYACAAEYSASAGALKHARASIARLKVQ